MLKVLIYTSMYPKLQRRRQIKRQTRWVHYFLRVALDLMPSEIPLKQKAVYMPKLEIDVDENVCSSTFLLFQKVTRGNSWESISEFTGVVCVDRKLTHRI